MSRWSPKFGQRLSKGRSEASQSEKPHSTESARHAEDCAAAKEQTKSTNRQTTSIGGKPSLAAKEERGLGTEGWLGLMIFLGVVLGLVYARLTLP